MRDGHVFVHFWSYSLRFIDFFRGPVVDNIRLQGSEHVYMFTAHKGKIYLRSYRLIIILFDTVPYVV